MDRFYRRVVAHTENKKHNTIYQENSSTYSSQPFWTP